MLVGYARTSSLGQVAGLEAQERELRAAGCDKIFAEQVSSVAQREQLEAALDYVREGDTFTVTKLDRLARSVGDLLEIVARLERRKVSLTVLAISGAEPLDTGTAIGRLMLAVIGAVGQAEREAMLERQREGIAKAKALGRYKGRVPTVRRQVDEKIIRLKLEGATPSEIASKLGIGRAACIGCWASRRRWRRDRSAAIRSRPGLTLPTCLPQTVKEVFVIFFAHVRCPVAGLVLQVPRCDRHCLVQRTAGFPVA
jgi:DNA invertase Pin-like site-specific DNA recombinase